MTAPLRTFVAKCWVHGTKTYWYDPKTDRFRCPIKGCEAFVNAEVALR